MVCPCNSQMYQYKKLGNGEMTEGIYTTWTILKCPNCGRFVREAYIAKEITEAEVKILLSDFKNAKKHTALAGKQNKIN